MNEATNQPGEERRPEAEPRSDEAIADAPLSLENVRHSGPGTWSTKDDPSPLRSGHQPAQPAQPKRPSGDVGNYSPQSLQIVKALEEGLRDPRCTQIDGYGPGKFTAQVDGRHQMLHGLSFASEEEYLRWLRSLVENSESIVTWEQIERQRMAVLELHGGERLCIYLPPIARPSATFSLRKHTAVDWPSSKLIELGTLDKRMHEFILSCVAARLNILFVGSMGGGKSSALRAFLQDGAGDDERIAIVEQVPELSIRKPLVMHQLYLPTVEGFGLADVLDYNLYNGLDRLIVGEIHMAGITKMLETMIVTEGSMSTYHAYSTDEAAERMKLALQIENPNATAETAASFIRQAVELVIVIEKLGERRVVTQVTEIDWRASSGEHTLGGRDFFTFDRERGVHRATGTQPDENGRLAAKFAKHGLKLDRDWFIEAEHIARFQAR